VGIGNDLAAKQVAAQPNAHALLDRVRAVWAPNLPLTPARAAARAAYNLLQGHAVAATGPETNAEADKAKQAVMDAGNRASDVFNGASAVTRRKTTVESILSSANRIASNPEVVQAISDASLSAAAAQEIARVNVTDPTPERIAYQAVKEVSNAAVLARNTAEARSLDEKEIRKLEVKSAKSTATKYATKNAVALSGKDIEMSRSAIVGTAPSEAIEDLNKTLFLQTARMAGLQIGPDGELAFDPQGTEANLIHQGQLAVRQLNEKVLGYTESQQMQAASDFQRALLLEANKIKRIMEANGGDDVEGIKAAVASIEQQVAIEQAKRDTAFAAWETAELTGEDPKEATEKALKALKNDCQAVQERAKSLGLDQMTARAAKAAQIAALETNLRDIARIAKASAGPDRDAQTATAKEAVEQIKKDIQTAKDQIAREILPGLRDTFVEKCANEVYEMLRRAYRANPSSLPRQLRPPTNPPGTDPVLLRNASGFYDSEVAERGRIVDESKSEIIKRENTLINKTSHANILLQNVEAVTSLMEYKAIQNYIIEIQANRLTPSPVVGSTLENIHDYNQRLQNIREQSEADIETRAKNAHEEADRLGITDVAARHAHVVASLARYVSAERGENTYAQEIAACEAKQEIEFASATIRGKITAEQDAAALAISNAYRARIEQIEQAVKGLTPDKAQAVRADVEKYYHNANASKDHIVRNADAADLGVRTAYRLQKGETNSKTLARFGDKARQAVEATSAIGTDIARTSGDTTVQSAAAKHAAAYARAQADIAQMVKVVDSHIEEQVRNKVTGTSPYVSFPGIDPIKDTHGIITENVVNYRQRAQREITQQVITNMMDLVKAELIDPMTGNLDSNKDQSAALEKGVAAARNYIAGFVGEEALAQNRTAATEAKGLAALTQHSADKATSRNGKIEDQAATDLTHLHTAFDVAAIQMVEDRGITPIAKGIKKVAETIQTAGSQAKGFEVDQVASEMAAEIRKAGACKQREILENILNETIVHAYNVVRNEATPLNTLLAALPGGPDAQHLADEARPRIEAEAKKALQALAEKGENIVKQYTAAVAAAMAQGQIESAKIVVVAQTDNVIRKAGFAPLTDTRRNGLKKRVDDIVKAEIERAGSDVAQRYIMAAVVVKELASLREQRSQAITNIASTNQANARREFNSSVDKQRIMHALRGRGSIWLDQELAMTDFAVRKNCELQAANNTPDDQTKAARKAFQKAEQAGEREAKNIDL
jgi:hypothetical protein